MTIYCIGRNYAEHAKELGNEVPDIPVVFMKSDISLRGFNQSILAFDNEVFHYEAELVLKIKKNFELHDKASHEDIESISLGIDLTRRQVQSQLKASGSPWTLAKSFQGAAIVGKEYSYSDYYDLKNILFEFSVNGTLKQQGETKDMLFSFIEICDYLNTFSPLQRGDLIFTGTPKGVGEIRRGDKFEMRLENNNSEIGEL